MTIAVLFFLGSMTLSSVILVNIAVSLITLAFEGVILIRVLRVHGKTAIRSGLTYSPRRLFGRTATQGFLLAILGTIFLYAPLLIANVYRSSDIILAGLGLALTVNLYLHRGQSAPFRVLMPKTSGDLARGNLPVIEGYVNRALKLGVLFNGFVAVVAVFYAAPLLSLLFAGEGLVATPFFMLMAGSLLIYPLAMLMMDTLIGLGRVWQVLLTYTGWTAAALTLLMLFVPIGREVIVAVIWIAGLPFLLVLLRLYQQRTGLRLHGGFLPRSGGVLLGIAFISLAILLSGYGVILSFNLTGILLIAVQVFLLISFLPLFLFYLWSLVKVKSVDSLDLTALSNISQVLHPVSYPVTWLLNRMNRQLSEASKPID